MKKIGIIICNRYHTCAGGKCLRALARREGAFSRYRDDQVELVGYTTCDGCPGGNVEYVPAEFNKNEADVVHLATGLVVGYPPCPHIARFKAYIESAHGLPVEVGTHPIPAKYMKVHAGLPFWEETGMASLAGLLLAEDPAIQAAYD